MGSRAAETLLLTVLRGVEVQRGGGRRKTCGRERRWQADQTDKRGAVVDGLKRTQNTDEGPKTVLN